jgi:RNA polymerase sigma-70 factor (ECF subfamily)
MESAAAPEISIAVETPASLIADFDALARQYWPVVFRFLFVSLHDRDAAETLTQDCFLKAYRHRERFRGDASVKTWLMQIAVNLARDWGRNRRLQFWKRTSSGKVDLSDVRQWVPDLQSSPEEQTLNKELVRAVWSAAAALPERQRTVLLLRFVEEMDLLEIARATGMKEGTVKTHLFRALHSVRERLGGEK